MADNWWGNVLFLLVELSHFPVQLKLILRSFLRPRFLKRRHLARLVCTFPGVLEFTQIGTELLALLLHLVSGSCAFYFSDLADESRHSSEIIRLLFDDPHSHTVVLFVRNGGARE